MPFASAQWQLCSKKTYGSRDNVGVLEWRRGLAGGHQARDVRHVHQQQRAVLVRDLAVAGVVPLARVGGAAGDEHGGLEERSLRRECVVVDEAGLRMHSVRERLKVNRSSRNGLAAVVCFGKSVKPVR